jgi:hypothetical protein
MMMKKQRRLRPCKPKEQGPLWYLRRNAKTTNQKNEMKISKTKRGKRNKRKEKKFQKVPKKVSFIFACILKQQI